jgi:alkylhydroperoxidase/carboxymuconolactone decarboxylase family protein YurZ
MPYNPMSSIKNLDEKLLASIETGRALAFEEGALSAKTKYLIALGIDASHGTEEGVRALASQALKNGATKEEIAEVLRVVNFISGVGSIYAAARALEGIL